jgi:hypothetical protein
VYIPVLKSFAKTRGLLTGQFKALKHFYDDDDFLNLPTSQTVVSEKAVFTIAYGGDLYQDMQPELREVVSFFKKNHVSKTKIELHVYTDARVPDFVKNIEGIHIFPSAGKSFYAIAKSADALLILLPKHKNHEFTTKFYDYMPLRKPYIIASQGGIVADFVVRNQMGYLWKTGDHYPWHENILANTFNFQPTYDIRAHSLSSAVKQLTSLFK